jgi:hypothetical protein
MALDPIAHKIAVGDRQSPVVVSAMVPQLDFNPVKDTPGGQAEDSVGWGFQHLNQARRKLPADLGSPSGTDTHRRYLSSV